MATVSDRDDLAKVLASRATEPRTPFPHEYVVAERILTSDWLATHDAEVRADERRRCVEAIEAEHPEAKTTTCRCRACDVARSAIRVVSGLGGEEVEGRG